MLAALVVGALTAWYLGMRAGVIAAVATFGALIAAAFVPGLSLAVYALVIAWSAALYFLGAKISQRKPGAGWLGGVTGLTSQASTWVRTRLGKR